MHLNAKFYHLKRGKWLAENFISLQILISSDRFIKIALSLREKIVLTDRQTDGQVGFPVDADLDYKNSIGSP